MKFGKLQDISQVDFSLRPDPPINQQTFDQLLQEADPAKVYIGCTGWSMKEWVGKVYPPKTKAADFLKAYAKQFQTIELNTTHYRIPTPGTIDKWYRESTPDFKFCPKIPQSISHSRDIGIGGGQIPLFCEVIQGLKEKLGCCFIQLPPYFGLDRLAILRAFLERFPNHIPLAVEVRHESWFENPAALQQLLDLLKAYNTGAVITDVAGRRDVLHMAVTAPWAMVRFVGNALHPTDYSRIDTWVQRLANWQQAGLKEIYFFPHEPDNLLAPDLSLYLHRQLEDLTNLQSRGPHFYEDPDKQQMSLF